MLRVTKFTIFLNSEGNLYSHIICEASDACCREALIIIITFFFGNFVFKNSFKRPKIRTQPKIPLIPHFGISHNV